MTLPKFLKEIFEFKLEIKTAAAPAKSGSTANLKFSNFQVESSKFLGFRTRPILWSNRLGELSVTREARLGDRKLVFRFSKIYALKNTAD